MANNIVQLQDKDGNNIFPISGGSESMPIGTEVNYDGETVPAGWQEVDDPYTYSTTEQRIGTWIDGKPLYRRVVETTSPATTGSGVDVVSYASWDVDKLTYIYGEIESQYNVAILGGYQFYIWARKSTRYITMQMNNDTYCSSSTTLIVEYTKTTD